MIRALKAFYRNLIIYTGNDNLLRPSVGAWISYGLGTENDNLPGFVSVTPPAGHGGARNYGSAFLPAHHQATTLGHSASKTADATIEYLHNPDVRRSDQQRQLEMVLRIKRMSRRFDVFKLISNVNINEEYCRRKSV